MIYAYARLSKETDGSVSIADQLDKIKLYASLHDLTVDAWYVDEGASGKNLDRPNMEKLLKIAKKGDKIVVLKLDRLTRSVRDLQALIDRKIQIVSIQEQFDTSTASGRMVMNMLGNVAQWERETISERTTAALTYRRQSGKVYGPTPFGWDRDGERLVRNESEQQTIAYIKLLRSENTGIGTIAYILNARGYKTKTGKEWTKSRLQKVMAGKTFA